MAVDKLRVPKRKKLKDNHPLKTRYTINRNKSKTLKSKNPNFVPLGEKKFIDGINEKDKEEKRTTKKAITDLQVESVLLSSLPAAQQLDFFLDRFQSANKSKLSPLELEAYKDTCMVELSKDINQDADNISKHIKDALGKSWKEVLCDEKLSEATIEPGSPAVLIISVSAIKSLELLRGLKVYTKKCRPAKLFAKHMKVEEQVELLRSRVNIASGTPSSCRSFPCSRGSRSDALLARSLPPSSADDTRTLPPSSSSADGTWNARLRHTRKISLLLPRSSAHKCSARARAQARIKKLVDMDALLLSRLEVLVLDMRSDAKGYSLLTLPQVSTEFWDLYRAYFNERIVQGSTKICFYGPAELRNPKKARTDY